MNYLAHLYFAEETAVSRVGNLMGDFHRGKINNDWPIALQQGVWLHRKIDAYTDQNSIFSVSRKRFSPPRRRLAGIILDVTFDHFLSQHWQQFCSIPRQQYLMQLYEDLRAYRGYCPEPMARVMALMVKQDWLSAYHEIDGVGLTLNRISQRFKRPTALYGAGDEVADCYELLEQDFLAFFPQLIEQVRVLKQSDSYHSHC